jgi:hypothetical protein
MDANPFPHWFSWFAPVWIAAIILPSIVYRKACGRPIFPRVPEHALFVERMASATFASNCLIVAVTDNELTVTPFFPFNLMFLPEIYGLEQHIPAAQIRAATIANRVFGANAIVIYGDGARKMGLRVRNPEGLIAALDHVRPS